MKGLIQPDGDQQALIVPNCEYKVVIEPVDDQNAMIVPNSDGKMMEPDRDYKAVIDRGGDQKHRLCRMLVIKRCLSRIGIRMQ